MKFDRTPAALSAAVTMGLGLSVSGVAQSATVLSIDLGDFVTGDGGAVSGFAFAAVPDGITPEVFGRDNDGTSGAAGDKGCKFSSVSPACEPIAFDAGPIRTKVFSTGFNFGGTGVFQPMVASAVGTDVNIGTAGGISATLNGPNPTDLVFTALDFAGAYNNQFFYLAPDALQNCSGFTGCGTKPGTGTIQNGFGYNVETLQDNGDNTYNVVIRWVGTINNPASPFHNFEANWRLEGLMTVDASAPPPGPPPGRDDIVASFGTLFTKKSGAGWGQAHGGTPPTLIGIADIDGSGKHDVIGGFASGVFARIDEGGWSIITGLPAESINTGDLDGNGTEDVVLDLGPAGLWARMNNSAWQKLSNSDPDFVTVGDIDGDGNDDVIADFATAVGGIYRKTSPTGPWSILSSLPSEGMATGDLDGDGNDDVVLDFGAAVGLYARMNNTSWVKLHNNSPTVFTVGQIDGSGGEDVVGNFDATAVAKPTAAGVWVKNNLGVWNAVKFVEAENLIVCDLDNSGQDDIIADFGAAGLFAYINATTEAQQNGGNATALACGDLDGSTVIP